MIETAAECAACGTNQKNQRTCCAAGGAWFGKCGTVDDSDADHTWAEGVEACKEPAEVPRTWPKHLFFYFYFL